MRCLPLVLALSLAPALAAAQQPHDTLLDRRGLPRDVAREAVRLYNADGTRRVSGVFDLASGQDVSGDVAVLHGPVSIAGHIAGSLLAVNGDVTLAPTARIDGDLLVVGGEVSGQTLAYVGGEIRIYRDPLEYRMSGDQLVTNDTTSEEEGWWRRFEPHPARSGSNFQVASAGAYNRVEGLPIDLGPQIYHTFDGWSAKLDAYAVVRTASSFRASQNDVGHNLHGEVRLGSGRGVLLGAGAYDLVTPVEDWGLDNLEAGLAAALFRRDYRDYYEQHGGSVDAGFYVGPDATFTVAYADEHWSPRAARDAWTLFNSNEAWRPNPVLDDAHVHRANATLRIDTRSDASNPWSGWYVLGDLEYGRATYDSLGPTTFLRAVPGDRPSHYDRGFVDLRRYNRVSRSSQLNFRVVAGGSLSGDPLPLERRLSVDGYDAVPGLGFRTPNAQMDAATCAGAAAPPGAPAQCDRILLGQAEYRSNLHVRLFDWDDDDWVRPHFTADGAWVMFVDAGRGWLLDRSVSAAEGGYASGSIPAFSTFRTDVGFGLDFGHVGVYVAKALSQAGQPARVFVRLQHRF